MNDGAKSDQQKENRSFLEKVMAGLTSYETFNEEIEVLAHQEPPPPGSTCRQE